MQTKTKTIVLLAYAFIAWAGVPLPGYAVDLIAHPRGGETWQTTTSDGVTVRTSNQNEIAFVLARDPNKTLTASSRAPAHVNINPNKTLTVTVTAYNSVPAQTDGSPCIAANGADICKLHAQGDYTCAAALPFNTHLSIPGFGVCTVRDRLAPRFAHRVDIHMGGADSIARARAWGKRQLTVTIIK